MHWMLFLILMSAATVWAAEAPVPSGKILPAGAAAQAGTSDQTDFPTQTEGPVQTEGAEAARRLVQQVQDLLRSDTSIARYTMRIETPEWQRSVQLDAWDDRPSKRFFIRILQPRKDRDTTWLKDGSNLWMYLPKLERDIRIPPSMMLSSWMGSDFTNDDLVKMESVVEDYTHRIVGDSGKEIMIASIPKPESAVVWGKIVHTIRPDGIPLSDDYYDEHGRHIRHLAFDQVRKLGGRMIPARWTMQPLNEPGKQTVMIMEEVQFDVPIEDSVFTRANLRRRGR